MKKRHSGQSRLDFFPFVTGFLFFFPAFFLKHVLGSFPLVFYDNDLWPNNRHKIRISVVRFFDEDEKEKNASKQKEDKSAKKWLRMEETKTEWNVHKSTIESS